MSNSTPTLKLIASCVVSNLRKEIIFVSILVFSPLLIVFRPSVSKVAERTTYYSASDLISEVNSLRISDGLAPYRVNSILMTVAQAHSDYQASIGVMTHYGAGGSRPFQRALAAGYPVAGDINLGGYFSENIAAGNFTIPDVISLWQGDQPHLETMLSSTLRDIGAGISTSGSTIYYTIDVGLSTTISPTNQNGSNQGFYSTYPPTIPIKTVPPGADGSIVHKVQLGETLWTIADVYHLSVEDLMSLNHLTTDIIFVGERIIIRAGLTPTTIVSPQNIQAIRTPMPTFIQTPSPTLQVAIKVMVYHSNQKYLLLLIVIVVFLPLTIISIQKLIKKT